MRGDLPPLEPQLQRVAALIARGYSSRQIAADLGVSVGAATSYVSQVVAFMRLRGRAEAGLPPTLSSRERQVAELVKNGATDREVAHRLGISLRTAEDHTHRILSKLGLRNRAAMAKLDLDA